MEDFYSAPGPMTDLSSCDPALFEGLTDDVGDLMRAVRGCVTSADLLRDIHKLPVPEGRDDEPQIRPVAAIVARIAELEPAPLIETREPERRILGTCRSFATLSCALVRRAGVPVRVRAGFAGYFRPDAWMDHWIIEYVRDDAWVRVDPELDDAWLAKHFGEVTSEGLATSMYRTGAETWLACRRGELDPDRCNMGGNNWGIGEVRGSVLLDLAAINQDEMLPWDTWARMVDAYQGRTDDTYDEMLDEVSELVVSDDFAAIRERYLSDETLRVAL